MMEVRAKIYTLAAASASVVYNILGDLRILGLYGSTNLVPIALSYTYPGDGTVISQIASYLYEQVPTSKEIINLNRGKVVVEFAFHDGLLPLLHHPAAGNVIRDSLKLVDYFTMDSTTEIGSTGVKYTSFNTIAQSCKVVVKAPFIVSGYMGAINKFQSVSSKEGQLYIENRARMGNYVSEIPAQYFTTLNKKMQKENKHDVPMVKFILQNLSLEMLAEVFISAMFKTFASDTFGTFVKRMGASHFLREQAWAFETSVFAFDAATLGQIALHKRVHLSVWGKLQHLSELPSAPLLFATDFIFKSAHDYYMAAVMSVPARLAGEFVKKLQKFDLIKNNIVPLAELLATSVALSFTELSAIKIALLDAGLVGVHAVDEEYLDKATAKFIGVMGTIDATLYALGFSVPVIAVENALVIAASTAAQYYWGQEDVSAEGMQHCSNVDFNYTIPSLEHTENSCAGVVEKQTSATE